MRAKDLHMAAVVDPVERVVYLTGAIDVNDTRINMEIELPEPGDWRLIKAETNLTDTAWSSWLITLGEGMRLRTGETARLFSRQFSRSVHSGRSFLFYDGCVRPGEPVVKVMDLHTDTAYLMASHNRTKKQDPDNTQALSEEAAREYLDRMLEEAARKPIVDIRASVTILETDRRKVVEPI